MAQIDHGKRKRSGLGWLWALIAIALLVVFAWWMFFFGDKGAADLTERESLAPGAPAQAPPATRPHPDDSVAGPNPTVATPRSGGGIIDVSGINEAPDAWAGQQVSGDLRVVEVPTDRTLFVEHEGERLMVIFHPVDVDDPPPEITDQVIIRVHNGRLARAADLAELETIAPIDPGSRSLLAEQAIFMVVDPERVEMVAEVRTEERLPEPE